MKTNFKDNAVWQEETSNAPDNLADEYYITDGHLQNELDHLDDLHRVKKIIPLKYKTR